MMDHAPTLRPQAAAQRPPRRTLHDAALLAVIGLALYLPAVNWGLPAIVSWSQDTIAGMRTLGPVSEWPADWKGRYPPLHYFILRAAYEPALDAWRTDAEADEGKVMLDVPRMGQLYLIARLVSVLMAIGCGIVVYVLTVYVFADRTAGFAAALCVMYGADFSYFARLGTVDIPTTFWFALSVLFYLRAFRKRRWQDCLWLGLFGGLAISTKDSTAGVYPGMALILLAGDAHHWQMRREDRRWLPAFVQALLQWRWMVGLLAFTLPYLFLNGIFHDPGPYVRRMKYWLDVTPGTLHAQQLRYDNQLTLLLAAVRHAAAGVGWPLLAGMVASCVYLAKRLPRVAAVLLVPAMGYYVLIIARIHFVYTRFLFPIFVFAAIATGAACALWLRNQRIPRVVRGGLLGIVAALTLGFTGVVALEMMQDTRYAAEAWFVEHAPRPSSVGAFAHPQYLPRLAELGYQTVELEKSAESLDAVRPDHIVLSSFDYEDYGPDERAFHEALCSGRLGYEVVREFSPRYLGGRSWFGLAGWGAPDPGKISPYLIILRRTAD